MPRRPKEPKEPNGEVVKALPGGLPFDIERLPPAEREFLRGVFTATGAAAAAAMQVENERHEQARPEFYGVSPTDLRRQFSSARPRQGAGLPPRNGKD